METQIAIGKFNKLAVWAITPNGLQLAESLVKSLPNAHLQVSASLFTKGANIFQFERLSEAVEDTFSRYGAHIFIMSTGIVVRMIAPYLRHKTFDPAVVVVDEKGRHAVSLLSGHLGGANDLTHAIAAIIGADPVITTATDLSGLPAIDVLAQNKGLLIENPEAIKHISMALLEGNKINLHDPYGLMADLLPNEYIHEQIGGNFRKLEETVPNMYSASTGVYVDDRIIPLPVQVLILRPQSLTAGIGCNRNTSAEEIEELLFQVLHRYKLAAKSLSKIGTVDLKADEPGLLTLSKKMKIPITFYTKQELNAVKEIQTPSAMVAKHIGVKSVCEAAAILAAGRGPLIVTKNSTRNVTVAIARTRFS